MALLRVGTENSTVIEIYYEDLGTGEPVVLVAGCPLDGRSWEKQALALLTAGYRVITYDRRGFGRSSRASAGFDFDTLAGDLGRLVAALDLRDCALVGHSMGAGEVIRLLARASGSAPENASGAAGRVRRAAFIAPLRPAAPPGAFDALRAAAAADYYAVVAGFLRDACNLGPPGEQAAPARVSEDFLRAQWNGAVDRTFLASLACFDSFATDLRADLERLAPPLLVLQGDADRITPLAEAGERIARLVRGARLQVISGAPHCLLWTHAEEVNAALLQFLAEG